MSKKEENRRIGQLGERIAAKFLENKGFHILERNLKYKFGEVDIIGRKGSTIHFVEVKSVRQNVTRENSGVERYRPEEQVHPKKLTKIRNVASVYMENKGKGMDCQIDVIAVFLDEAQKIGKCRFNENVS